VQSAGKHFLVVPLHFFGSKSTIIVVLVSAFLWSVQFGQFLVCFSSTHGTPPCPAICKRRGHVPPCLMESAPLYWSNGVYASNLYRSTYATNVRYSEQNLEIQCAVPAPICHIGKVRRRPSPKANEANLSFPSTFPCFPLFSSPAFPHFALPSYSYIPSPPFPSNLLPSLEV